MDEKEALTPEIVDNTKIVVKREKNPALHNERGKFAVGHPKLGGREKGSLNRLTRLKEKLLKVASEEKVEELYRGLCKGGKQERVEALRMLISMLPKESSVDMKLDAVVGPRIIIIRPGEKIEPEGGSNG